MGSLDKPAALRLLTLFSGAAKGMTFYPASHQAIRQPLMELYKILTAALNRDEQLSWGVVDGILYFEDHLFISPSAAISDLTSRMTEHEVSGITAAAPITFEDLEAFITLFSVKGLNFDAIAAKMTEQGIKGFNIVRDGDELPEKLDDEPDAEFSGNNIATYNRALSAIKTICRDIERGRIPNSAPLIKVVDQMVVITMQEPLALLGLTMIKDYDNYTFNHCVNVGVLSMALGATLGLDAETVRDLGFAGQLHDIGKTMISKDILHKPGKLSSDEFEEMRRHPELGAKIITEMHGLTEKISSVVLGHHLHYDRSGYPEWAKGIPQNKMIDIVAIADTYDAITTLRVYQHPVNPKTALREMLKLSHTILDGAIVERFVDMMGSYPVGTLVRLDTNEVAIVYRPNPLNENAPSVRILIDSEGIRLRSPREQALATADGSCYAEIVAVVDPLLKNIDIGHLFANGHH